MLSVAQSFSPAILWHDFLFSLLMASLYLAPFVVVQGLYAGWTTCEDDSHCLNVVTVFVLRLSRRIQDTRRYEGKQFFSGFVHAIENHRG